MFDGLALIRSMTGQPAIGRGKREFDYPAIRLSGHLSMVALVAGLTSRDCNEIPSTFGQQILASKKKSSLKVTFSCKKSSYLGHSRSTILGQKQAICSLLLLP
jgi:hypothetical protein